ncbi:MAG: DNA gyrase subunit A [Gemmatimonadota bacterium]|nr:MAG: DNA gyrase subunit A [Gemmatimonadota bacterium]
MAIRRENVIPIYIEEEMRNSYIDYSMSVIVSRALPDVRDGLKPSQRRILVAMNDLNLSPGRPHRKCAKIAGDTSGNYHPHGEQVVYPTLVRLAQDFNMRYPLVEGQGNFGSIDGDPPAAMRYTEARLNQAAMEMLSDLEKETVNFQPNYDETRQEPTILPGKFPNLICNGSSGIAVGMATNIPPHNLAEVIDGLVALIENADMSIEELMEYIQGPDFPTGGLIFGRSGIADAYRTGRGRLLLRARASTETLKTGRENIVITEIPFMVNKTNLIEKIAELIREKRITDISDLRDESDRDGMRIVLELKRDAQAEVILNQLYKHTQMQSTFGIILLALVDSQPRVLNLKDLLQCFIDHRHEVIVRRTKFDLSKAEKRAHILEGLKIALDHIDAVIALIKKSKTPETAKNGLMRQFSLSEVQAQAILDMRLQRLTGLEREKIESEYLDLIKKIAHFKAVLESRAMQLDIVKSELIELKNKFADERRTEILAEVGEFSIEDLIAEEEMVITISHAGYIKRCPITTYRRQRRGGRGVTGAGTKEEDFIEHLFIASTHAYILCFSDKGRCYWLKVHEIPQGGRLAKGKAIVNLLQMESGEKVAAIMSVKEFDESHYIVMATEGGLVKKTNLMAYSRPRRGGINAINIVEEDQLIEAKLTNGSQDIILGTRDGQAIRFNESEVRDMGRTAQGVKGVKLRKGDEVVGMVVVQREGTLLVVTENGYGKRTSMMDYPVKHRAGMGVITIRTSQRNGKMVTIKEVVDDDELMIITVKGVVIRLPIIGIKTIGRNTQGVKLIRLDKGDKVIDVARLMIRDEGNNTPYVEVVHDGE